MQLCGMILLLICLLLHCCSAAWNVTFITCMSYTSLAYSYDYYGPAIDMALLDLRKTYTYITWSKVNLSPENLRTCYDLDALSVDLITDYLFNNQTGREQWDDPTELIVIITSGCSDALQFIAYLAKAYNLPIIVSGGYINEQGQELPSSRFPTMFRLLSFKHSQIALTLLRFLQRYNWTDIALFCDLNHTLGIFFKVTCAEIENILHAYPEMRFRSYRFNTQTDRNYSRYLTMANKYSRVIVILAHGNKTRDIMITATKLGMTNGDYVYIAPIPMEHPLYALYKWEFKDEYDEIAKEAFESLYFVSTRPMRGSNYLSFEMEVKYRAYKCYSFVYGAAEAVSSYVALQHTIVLFTGKIINETIIETGQIQNGARLMARAFQRRLVASVTGDFIIDKGDRLSYTYVIVGMEHDGYTFNEYFEYDTLLGNMLPVRNHVILWAHRKYPPPNRPECGFNGMDEICSSARNAAIGIGVGSVLALLLLALSAGYLLYRFCGKMLCADVTDQRWHVVFEELGFDWWFDPTTGLASSKSPKHSIAVAHRTSVTFTSNGRLALYKGKIVWVHKFRLVRRFSPQKEKEMLLRKMKLEMHPNIAIFYGLAANNHPLEMNVICEVAFRGSLFDILHNEIVKFDKALATSIIADITNGMIFLHDSIFCYNGNLSCESCLIDGRFAVKIAYFRLDILPRLPPDNLNNYENCQRFLTFPPEQLRAPLAEIYYGSKQGDVYCYGHLLAQIIMQSDPFQPDMDKWNLTPKDILAKIKGNSVPSFRPMLTNILCQIKYPPALISLIHQCWDDDSNLRPTFHTVQQVLQTLPEFECEENFIASLFHRLETYAQELEKRVSIATADLAEEKKRSEELLFQLLPRHIALELTQGKKVEAELFESVTIGFTALANFLELTTQSSPMELVQLLNDLYVMFDATLEEYDVYKVETIADSYMIASGVPVRNGVEHSCQIARLALDLVAKSMSPRQSKNIFQVKIGFHSGNCVAGVVGVKMPRYCLFGDTVNTASRMATTSLPLKIQLSTSTMENLRQFNQFCFEFRGLIEIKGKGLQCCYWLLSNLATSELNR